ncbi:DUF7672 family protein [Winogradskyella alexanderae]|uniref:Uncharacterized protein n=1 Tax=Winogradskyella alexanderae TaxID=2877123 RepID=A0ABS7XVM6_9FLAO|nr:hypothetical protein [Winogradskyella alexanderae]MCA0132881.1 hypothetical protein [Winogradskyella alexanderae]
MIRLYIIGLFILIIAIIANGLIIKIGLKSWYDLFALLDKFGTGAFKELSILDYVWLFVGYPLVLGCGYWIGKTLHKLIFN